MTSARADTRYLCAAALEVDLGQRLTDITLSGAAAYEDPSPRTALDGTGDGRAIELELELSNLESSTILFHGGDVAAKPYGLTIAAGVVSFVAGGLTLATLAVDVGPTRDFILSLCTQPNPDTTGAGDALRTELALYDVSGGSLTWVAVTHAVHAADVAGAFSIGGRWDGAVMQAPFGLTIAGARVSARWHSRVEVREHWVAQTAAPTVGGFTCVEDAVFPADAQLAKSLVGPQYQAAAAAMGDSRNRFRLVSPIVQCLHGDFATLGGDLAAVFGAGRVLALEGGFEAPAAWMVKRRIPRHCDWLLVRVQWATWDDPSPGVPDLVELRAHTSDAHPVDAEVTSTRTISRAVDDSLTGFLGVQETFSATKVERDVDGWSWVYFSARTNGGAPSTAQYSVREMTITPMAAAVGYLGLAPGEWGG